MITKDQISKAMPGCKMPGEWAQLLSDNFEKYGFTSAQQKQYFIAQCGHESMDFNILVENLNYSSDALLRVFPKYFGNPPKASAAAYNRQPEKIANVVYANRMGNGNEASGDGWKFRGRGILMITGKNNYAACSKFIFGDDTLLSNPDLLSAPEYALKSAFWFWTSNGLLSITDYNKLTVRINGGTNGADDRNKRLAAAKLAI
jgi:putative chitinase